MIDTAGLIDSTNGKLQLMLKFAEDHSERSSLEQCLKNLQNKAGSSADAKVELYADWAPYSITFVYTCKLEDIKPLVGGIIYHGYTGIDPMSVTLEPSKGWLIHT